ncbi:hypothetical protein ABBQ38_002159 [Trebouxia sp. C0009 RCD-2024]
MRVICGKRFRRVLLLLLVFQVPHLVSPSKLVKQTAFQGSGGQLAVLRSSYLPESQLGFQASNTARNLLQFAEQGQSQGQGASSSAQHVAAEQAASAASAAVQNAVTAGAVAAEAQPKDTSTNTLLPGIHQYQPSSMPFVSTDRLISAAVVQASQIMADTTAQHEGESQFDAWPLVNPLFQEALHECFGSSKLHRVCKYYNLLLWNGTLYYPTTDVGTLVSGPPRVPISWVSLSPFDKMEFGQDQWAEVVHPSDLPFNWETTPKLSMKEALFWKLTFQDNYGHLLGEHGPIIHNLMCSYLNRCSYTEEDLKDFHILLANDQEEEISVMPAASQEMFNCFCKRALMLHNDIFFKDHVVVVGTLLAGIGPTCRGYPWCRPQWGRSPMVGNMVTTWQERMLDCTGMPRNVIAPADTINVAVIDRHYSAGRSFLNLPDVISHLQARFPGTLNITVDKLEGKSLRQQAALYYNASIVIQTHGAALGNVIFLPRGAVVIDIVPENNEDKSPWVVYMCADFKPLFISPIVIPPQKTVLQMAKVRRTKEWAMLTPYWRQRILREGVCPEDADLDWQMDAYAACNFQWFLKSGNLVLDFTQVGDALQTGVTHVRGVHDRMLDYVHKSYEFDLTAAVV